MDSCHMCQETLCHHVTARFAELEAEVDSLHSQVERLRNSLAKSIERELEMEAEVERVASPGSTTWEGE